MSSDQAVYAKNVEALGKPVTGAVDWMPGICLVLPDTDFM